MSRANNSPKNQRDTTSASDTSSSSAAATGQPYETAFVRADPESLDGAAAEK
jgi:hypothetical protein